MSRYITLLVVVAASLCLANSNFLLADAVTQKIDVDTLKQPNDKIEYKLTFNQTLTWNVEGFTLVKEPTIKEANLEKFFFKIKGDFDPNAKMYSLTLLPIKNGTFSSTFVLPTKKGNDPEKDLEVKIDFEITGAMQTKVPNDNAMLSITKLALVVVFAVFCF